MTSTRPGRPIATSRLLVGILLHFCVPAYLLVALAAALLRVPAVASWPEVPARMLWAAAWFVPGFLIAVAVAAAAGALIDRRRVAAPDGATASRQALAEGRRALGALAHPVLDRALARLDAHGFDHGDPRQAQVAADLLAAARTFTAAHASATPAGRAGVGELAAAGVHRLADALAGLTEERRRLDEGDARTVAGYLEARYGAPTPPAP